MPPTVIDLRKADDTRDVVHRAVQSLAEGRLVVFPTETVYGVGASARSEDGVEKIFQAKGRAANAPLALKAIKAVLVRQMTFRDDIPHADLDEQLGIVRTSADAKEGIAAFLERRKPNFQER